MDMIAYQLGWVLDHKTEDLEPVLAEEDVDSGHRPIKKGNARGVEQIGRAYIENREVITLQFRAAVGEPVSYDRIIIEGEPHVDSTIAGGVNGDIATCAVTLNAVRSVLAASPGLKTMCDIPPVSCCGSMVLRD
jgi:4-hydroxy-tetrahydrodipicolinate reductase